MAWSHPAADAEGGTYAGAVTARFRDARGHAFHGVSSVQTSLRLISAPQGSSYLADLRRITTTASGFSPVANAPTPPAADAGVDHTWAVITPSPASADYYLAGQCSRFTSTVVLDDHDAFGTRHHGRIVFRCCGTASWQSSGRSSPT